jgi:hypothetical protein
VHPPRPQPHAERPAGRQNPRRSDKPFHLERQPGIAYDGDYTDTFDSRHYIVAPGYFEVELAAATHFKDRAVVPGSRNPETNFQASFIAIIGVVAPTGTGFTVLKAIDPPRTGRRSATRSARNTRSPSRRSIATACPTRSTATCSSPRRAA